MVNQVEVQSENYKVAFDSQEQNVMYLTIPIKAIAASPNKLDAQVYLRGFFEEAKEQALLQVSLKRREYAKSGVLVPNSVAKVNLTVQ